MEKTKTYAGVSLWVAAVILYLVLAVFSITAAGFMEGAINLIKTLIVAVVISVIIAIATVQKEKVLTYTGMAFAVLVLGEIARLVIEYVQGLLPM